MSSTAQREAGRLSDAKSTARVVAAFVERARAAQAAAEGYDQARVDELVTAAGWAIVNPEHNRRLAELAVRDTGLGNVADKIAKNRRKTIGLLADLGFLAGPRGEELLEQGAQRRLHVAHEEGGRQPFSGHVANDEEQAPRIDHEAVIEIAADRARGLDARVETEPRFLGKDDARIR